jgi:hypothetical protein
VCSVFAQSQISQQLPSSHSHAPAIACSQPIAAAATAHSSVPRPSATAEQPPIISITRCTSAILPQVVPFVAHCLRSSQLVLVSPAPVSSSAPPAGLTCPFHAPNAPALPFDSLRELSVLSPVTFTQSDAYLGLKPSTPIQTCVRCNPTIKFYLPSEVDSGKAFSIMPRGLCATDTPIILQRADVSLSWSYASILQIH